MHSQDGYKLVSAGDLVGVLHALNERQITFRAFRAYVGSLELLAIREAAGRSHIDARKKPQRRFLCSELAHLIKAKDGTTVTKELSLLKKTGMLSFSEASIDPGNLGSRGCDLLNLLGSRGGKRLIPIPRQVLKFLASCSRPALAKTVVAYLIRGLALERSGNIRSAGTVKISWICQLCKISERAARAARAELIRLGWITKDSGSFQRKLNRDGAYFVINPFWRRTAKQSAPPMPEKCTGSAPLIEKQETPYGSKNQKPAPRTETGVYSTKKETVLEKPTLTHIRFADLQRMSRLRVLYEQATAEKWLTHSEANLRNFVAAAARATRVEGDAVRVFVGIVRRGLWHHLTGADEDRAMNALKREHETQLGEAVNAGRGSGMANDTKGRGILKAVLDVAMQGKPNLAARRVG